MAPMGGDVFWPDLMRGIAMFGLGAYAAAKLPVIVHHAKTMAWFRRGRLRFDDVAVPLYWRSATHVLALGYLVADLASRLGSELTWRAPAALVVVGVGLVSLWRTAHADQRALAAVREDKG